MVVSETLKMEHSWKHLFRSPQSDNVYALLSVGHVSVRAKSWKGKPFPTAFFTTSCIASWQFCRIFLQQLFTSFWRSVKGAVKILISQGKTNMVVKAFWNFLAIDMLSSLVLVCSAGLIPSINVFLMRSSSRRVSTTFLILLWSCATLSLFPFSLRDTSCKGNQCRV